MKKRLLAWAAPALLGLPISGASADVLLSEIRIDNGGTDAEYLELFNTGTDPVDLSTYNVVVIGDGNGGDGSVEDVISFDGLSIAPGSPFLVLQSSFTGIEIDADGSGTSVTNAVPDLSDELAFENSDNLTFLLVTGYTAGAEDLDADDDGTLELPDGTVVIDAVSLVETPDSGDAFYATTVGGVDVGPNGPFVPAHVFRSESSGSWIIGAFGGRGTATNPNFARLQLGDDGVALSDTPGVINPAVQTGSLEITFSTTTLAENSSSVLTGTVERLDDDGIALTSGELTINISSSDLSEADVVTTPLTIADGSSTATFEIFANDDVEQDGTQTVTISAEATGFTVGSADITITDDGDVQALMINELYYRVDAATGDANADGEIDFGDDEFVEIVNTSASPVDLTDYTLSNRFTDTPNHEFRRGTVLAPGASLVIFGGGNVLPGHVADKFGTAEAQLATEGNLGISSNGDVVILFNDAGEQIASVVTPAQTDGTLGSYTRATDGDPTSGFVFHTATTSTAAFSPGQKLDGTNFATVTETIALSTTAMNISESGDPFNIDVTVSAAPATNLILTVIGNDQSELIVDDFPDVEIAAGDTMTSVIARPEDDESIDGTQTVTVFGIASGYLTTTLAVDIEDDGDAPLDVFEEIVINEIDADTPGNDTLEFVELFNPTTEEQSLDGLIMVFFNGSDDASTGLVVELDGVTIPAGGFYVVGGADVANVDSVQNNNFLQNGADAVAIIAGNAVDFPNDTPAASFSGQLITAIVYGTGDPTDDDLIAALTPGGVQLDENANGAQQTEAIARTPDGASTFTVQAPTPGAANGDGTPPAGGFATYAAANGGSDSTAPDDDSDGDGIPALIEYALGFRLDAFNAMPQPVASGDSATITFAKGTEAAADSSIVYVIEVNDELTVDGWETLDTATDGADEISGTIPAFEGGKGFARLSIQPAS